MKKLIAVNSLLILSVYVYSQKTVNIDEVVVTATKIPMETYKTGRSVEVIGAEEIHKLPVQTVDDLLRYISGVNINSRNHFGVQADIGMRGSIFSQVLVLLDNVRLNDPLTAHFNNNIPIALAEIDHIEIVKGPAAASYGSDAVGGVIHIKSKTYIEKQVSNEFSTSGNLAIGEHDLLSTDAGVMLNNRKWLFSASVKTTISDGEEHINPNFEAGVSSDSLYNNYFDIRSYTASLGYLFNDNLKLYSRFAYDMREFSAKFFYTRSPYDESTEKTSNRWGQVGLQFSKNKHALELNAGYKVADDYFEFNPLFVANEHRTKQININFSNKQEIGPECRLGYGVQYLYKSIQSTDRGDHSNSSYGIYGIYSQDFFDDLHLNLSMRLEYDDNFKWEVLPQAAISYRFDNLILRTSYGRSVRAPDFTERFVSYNIENLSPGRNAGNPDLLAERSHSVDLGFDLYLPKQFNISSSVFYRNSKNLIDYSLRNSNDIDNLDNLLENEEYFYADNVSSSEVFGVELTLAKDFSFSEDYNLDLKATYTFLNTSTDATELSKYISNHPEHDLSAIIDIRLYKFHIISSSFFITRDLEAEESIGGEVPDQYFVSNLKIAFDLINSLSIYGMVQNIGDTNYQEILGAKLPGRWFSGGIKWDVTSNLNKK